MNDEFDPEVIHKVITNIDRPAGDPGDNYLASDIVIHNSQTRAEKADVLLGVLLSRSRGRGPEAAWCFAGYMPQLAGAADCYVMAHQDVDDPAAMRLYSRCARDHEWMQDLRRAALLRGLDVRDAFVRDGRQDLLIWSE